MSWIEACERLWGPDWIAPASEVLGINRRTLERAKSGAKPLNPRLAADLERIGRGPDPAAYGAVLRRLSRGETPEQIRAEMASVNRALARYKADRGRYAAIAVLAGMGDDGE